MKFVKYYRKVFNDIMLKEIDIYILFLWKIVMFQYFYLM